MARVRIGGFARVGKDNVVIDSEKIAIKRGLAAFLVVGKDSINKAVIRIKKGLGAYSLLGRDLGRVTIGVKKALYAPIEAGRDNWLVNLRIKRSLSTNTCIVGRDDIRLITIIRHVLGNIPTGQIFLLTENGEKPLNNQRLHRGDSNVLNIYVEGERIVPLALATKGSLAGMNLTFTVKRNPQDSDDKAVIKKSLKKGQMYFNGIREVVNYSGTVKKASYQLMILPADTEKLTKTEVLYYDLQLDSGIENGERYTIEGRKGEKLTIDYDLYRS